MTDDRDQSRDCKGAVKRYKIRNSKHEILNPKQFQKF
jgi:hypothetical protein